MAPTLRSASSLGTDLAGPSTPAKKREARSQAQCRLLELPCELLERSALAGQDYKTLCALASTCAHLRTLSEDCALWRAEWENVYGDVGAVQEAAAVKAGGFKRLFAARAAALKEAEPWQKPSTFEIQASVDMLTAVHAAGPAKEGPSCPVGQAGGAEAGFAPAEQALCLVFLVDGSGSVTEEDFRVMTDFMLQAVQALAPAPAASDADGAVQPSEPSGGAEAAAAAAGPHPKVAVIQFSNDVRVEQGPADVDVAAFEALMAGMARMNGGTNIALAVQKAGQLLKPLGPEVHRVLVLLTDGRIDSHQSREARDMAERLADEQGNVRLHAYGVGRGVDKQELLRICAARDPASAEDRYLSLMVLDEAPW